MYILHFFVNLFLSITIETQKNHIIELLNFDTPNTKSINQCRYPAFRSFLTFDLLSRGEGSRWPWHRYPPDSFGMDFSVDSHARLRASVQADQEYPRRWVEERAKAALAVGIRARVARARLIECQGSRGSLNYSNDRGYNSTRCPSQIFTMLARDSVAKSGRSFSRQEEEYLPLISDFVNYSRLSDHRLIIA